MLDLFNMFFVIHRTEWYDLLLSIRLQLDRRLNCERFYTSILRGQVFFGVIAYHIVAILDLEQSLLYDRFFSIWNPGCLLSLIKHILDTLRVVTVINRLFDVPCFTLYLLRINHWLQLPAIK